MHPLSIFPDLNVVKILGVGLSGLSLLLMVLAYQLLRRLIDEPHPNPQIVSLVKFYLGCNIVVLLVVGVFSLPLVSKNNQLNTQVASLGQEKQQITAQTKQLLAINQIKENLAAVDTATNIAQVKMYLNQAKVAADSFKTSVAATGNVALKQQAAMFMQQLKIATESSRNPASVEGNDSQFEKAKQTTKVIQLNFDKDIYSPAKERVQLSINN